LEIAFATAGGLGGGAGSAQVALYDIQGRLVRTLAQGTFPAGVQTVTWDGGDNAGRPVGAGVYFLRAVSAGERTELKLVVLR
jgi:flagellar hook assembly protein FlgD